MHDSVAMHLNTSTCVATHVTTVENGSLRTVDGGEFWTVDKEVNMDCTGIQGLYRWCYQPGTEAAKAAEARRTAKRSRTGGQRARPSWVAVLSSQLVACR